MKIGILTFHAVSNYGAVLQGYALQQYLKECGHDVEFIDYRPPYLTTGGYFHLPKSAWHIKANVVIAYQKIMALKSFLNENMRSQSKRFDLFTKEYLSLSPRRYRDIKSLRKNPPEEDIYICGSDQIWNPSQQYGLDAACFLNFGLDKTKKIAYAASFGCSSIPERHHHEVKEFSEKLDAVSVRESSGCAMFERLTGGKAQLVPDPTFLINWETILKAQPTAQATSKNKLFSYVLRSGTGLYEFQQELSKSLGLEVIQPLNPHQRWKSFGEVIPMSPVEWLRSIQHSSAVITNSFHGTVFSILFNRPFLSVQLSGTKAGLNERMRHLLKSLGLENRQISLEDRERAVSSMNEPINWSEVNQRAEAMKAEGINFLSDSINSDFKSL